MSLKDLDDLRAFVAIVDKGGLSAAMQVTGSPKSTLSRRLGHLEAAVGARLLDRTTRGIRLTEAGSTVYHYAARILQDLARLDEATRPGPPSGLLRVTCSFTLAAVALRPILPEFLARYPAIDLELDAASQRRDHGRDDFDVALRAGPLSGGAMIARRLGRIEIGLFAAPGLAADAPPHQVEVMLAGARPSGPHGRPRSRLAMNDPLLVKGLVIDGFGAAWLPTYLCTHDVAAGRLVQRTSAERHSSAEVFALYPGRKDMPAKSRAFIDFLIERLVFDPM